MTTTVAPPPSPSPSPTPAPTPAPTAAPATPGLILAGIDSLTDGAANSNWRKYFTPRLRATYGDGGPGWQGFTYGLAVDQGVGFYKSGGVNYVQLTDGIYGNYSLDGNGLYTAGATGTDYFGWTPAGKWTTARVYFLVQPGGGTFKIGESSYPTTAGQVMNTSGLSVSLGWIDVAYNGHGSAGLLISQITGNVCIFGANFSMAGGSGASLANIAAGGRTLESVAAQDSTMRRAWYAALTPSHVFLNAGMNDRITRTAAQHHADLDLVVTDILAASPATKVVIVQSSEPSDHATTNFDSYYTQKVVVAGAHALELIDLRQVLGGYATAAANGLMADGVHPNDAGDQLIAARHVQFMGLSTTAADPGVTPYPA